MLSNALSNLVVTKAKPGPAGRRIMVDGEGLRLEVTASSKRWQFLYNLEGKPLSIAMGRFPQLSLSDARRMRSILREAKQRGICPKLTWARIKEARGDEISIERAFSTSPAHHPVGKLTFRDAMLAYHADHVAAWSEDHARYWLASLERAAAPLMTMKTLSISTEDIARVIEPIWAAKHNTATRVLGRIEAVIGYAMKRARVEKPNPVAHLLLPKVRVEVQPRAAMPWTDVPAFYRDLVARDGIEARALQLLLLLCCPRTSEVLFLTWGEVEADRIVIPAVRMKNRKVHEVPLSAHALDLLAAIRPAGAEPGTPVFPSVRKRGISPHSDAPFSGFMSRDTMQILLGRMGQRYMVHGFRSSFADWIADNHPEMWLAGECALAHQVGSAVERAYRRSSMLPQRRILANMWAAHLSGA